jgi:phosphate transport system substrate-binding protein
MHKIQLAGMTSAVAVLACFGSFDKPASAQVAYSGGSTLAGKVLRQEMDCLALSPFGAADYGSTTTEPFPPISQCTSGPDAGSAMILYAPVGSGAGKKGFIHHDPGTAGLNASGAPSTSSVVPYTSTILPTSGTSAGTYPYPTVNFTGSDDVLTYSGAGTDYATYFDTTYTPTGGPTIAVNSNYGNWFMMPSLITPVTLALNGKDGANNPLTVNTVQWPDGHAHFSPKTACGILAGTITQWNDASITADNGGSQLGTGQIIVVHRGDGSGTTYIAVNGLLHTLNCGSSGTAAFPFTDGASASLCPTPPVEESSTINWPDDLKDQCGTAITNPAGAVYYGFLSGAHPAKGSGGVQAVTFATPGAIAYLSPDYTAEAPVNIGAGQTPLPVAFIGDTSGSYWEPSAGNAATAMSGAQPSFTQQTVVDPRVWAQLGHLTSPPASGYPLSGFSWLNFYECYNTTSAFYNMVLPVLYFHYTDPKAAAALTLNGFAPVTNAWVNAISYLVSASYTPLNSDQPGTPACTGRGGA